MTLHVVVMEALGSGQADSFYWHPFCRVLFKTKTGVIKCYNNCKIAMLTVLTLNFFFAFGVSVQISGEQTAQQRKEE